MSENKTNTNHKKGFWARLLEKIDKMMEEKAQSQSCCCGDKEKKC